MRQGNMCYLTAASIGDKRVTVNAQVSAGPIEDALFE
jgi:hypothetical protein